MPQPVPGSLSGRRLLQPAAQATYTASPDSQFYRGPAAAAGADGHRPAPRTSETAALIEAVRNLRVQLDAV